jgi:hypothetical protein
MNGGSLTIPAIVDEKDEREAEDKQGGDLV